MDYFLVVGSRNSVVHSSESSFRVKIRSTSSKLYFSLYGSFDFGSNRLMSITMTSKLGASSIGKAFDTWRLLDGVCTTERIDFDLRICMLYSEAYGDWTWSELLWCRRIISDGGRLSTGFIFSGRVSCRSSLSIR